MTCAKIVKTYISGTLHIFLVAVPKRYSRQESPDSASTISATTVLSLSRNVLGGSIF